MRKGNKFFYTDLLILRELFFEKEQPLLVVSGGEEFQDNENKIFTFSSPNESLISFCNNISTKFILVNKSHYSLEKFYRNPNLEGAIEFSGKNKKSNLTYYFFNNPDGSMRWVFPKKNKSPAFLNLYNGSGWKAKVFKTAAKTLHTLGWIKPITSGQFSIFSKNKNTLSHHSGDLEFDDFAIFTGTVGENRKAIIVLTEQKKCTQFIKIPLTQAAQKLVENEHLQLSNLSTNSFETLIFPKVKKTKSGVAVSNIKPVVFENGDLFQEIHFQALAEVYDFSHQTKTIDALSFWKTIDDGIRFFQKNPKLENGLSQGKTKQLRTACEHVFYNIDTADFLKVGIGHGDFTPWNMYLGKTKLHLYDWEMCATDTPLLFDMFHYFFQKGILIDRKGIEEIENNIQNILKLPTAKAIISKYQLDWKKHYQLYLLYIICYYFPKYAVQPRLHEQVFWLTDTWLAGLKRIEIEVV